MTTLRNIRHIFKQRVVLVVTFPSRRTLHETLARLMRQGMVENLDIGHAALITRSQDGTLSVHNNSVTAREGWISGMMLGATIMALGAVQYGALDTNGVGAALVLGISFVIGGLLGSLLGYMAARWIDFGFDPALLQDIVNRLVEGEVALVLQVRRSHAAALWTELAVGGGRVEDRSDHPAR